MEILNDFISSVLKKDLGVYGIHIYQNGKVLAEHRFRSNDRENLCSASKTFVSAGIGIAESEGILSLSDPVLDFFPEFKGIASPGSETMKIYHLLRMSSGHAVEDFSQYNIIDRAELFFSTEMSYAAGTRFFYEDLCSYMLGRVIEKVAGCTLLAYMKPRFFDKLEIINPQWHTCQLGHTACSGGLYLTTEEFSRIGITLLNGGVYANKQLLPSDYVQRMHSNWIDTSAKNHPETQVGYGFQVWKCTPENSYRADGMYGQMCIVLEDYNAVITVTAHNEREHKDILLAIWQDVLGKLG